MRHGPRTMAFRHLASSWGLAVDLTATLVDGELPPRTAEEAAPGIWLDTSSVSLVDADKEQLIAALSDAGPTLSKAIATPATLVIEALGLTPTDFQPEALYCATLGWLAEAFTIELALPTITFDRAANRYVVTRAG